LNIEDEVISFDDLNKIIENINDQHNFNKAIQRMKNKTPNEITLEDVKELNRKNKEHNLLIDSRDMFKRDDICKVQLTH
jgi:hypothetical protein